MIKLNKALFYLLIIPILFVSCKGPDGKFKLPGGDARKFPDDPKKRIEQNLREGRGVRLTDTFKNKGGVFDFASSNELWRASLDVIDFMPLLSVNYSGGIIVTDWYSQNNLPNESIKISIRFLTNEIRSDALEIKIFKRKCVDSLIDCSLTNTTAELSMEIKKEILKRAAIYKQESKEKNPKQNNTSPKITKSKSKK